MKDFQYWYNKIENEIKNLPLNGKPDNLYEPAKYLINLGGKRIRPALFLMSHQVFDVNADKFISTALAFELFHNFTLVHDDLMDESEIRRGKPTVHKKWNASTAILSGDNMLITVYDLLLLLPVNIQIKAIRLFNKMAHQLCEGQQLDVDFEVKDVVSEQEYKQMIEYKTSVLLGCSMQLGALSGGASDDDAQSIYDSGIKMGTAFQLLDDYLDAFGTSVKVGKKIGGDILVGKKTALYTKALAILKGDELKGFVEIYNSQSLEADQKIKQVKSIMINHKIDELVKEDAKALTKQAKLLLDKLDQNVNPILNVYDWLLERLY